jgi:hypothetical protein
MRSPWLLKAHTLCTSFSSIYIYFHDYFHYCLVLCIIISKSMKVDRCMGTRQASPTKAWSCTGKIDNHKWLACSTRINSKIWAKCHVSLFYEWELGPNPPIKMNITTSKHQICLSLMIHILATETALWPCFFVHVSLMRKTLMARQPTSTISSENPMQVTSYVPILYTLDAFRGTMYRASIILR